jgi:alpha-mannosidase
LPGIPPSSSGISDTTLENEFTTEGADFLWRASDTASEVFTHWMPGPVPGYYQGKGLVQSKGQQPNIVETLKSFLSYFNLPSNSNPPFSAAPTNYVYMPLDEDFMLPIEDLLEYVKSWNTSGQTNGVYGVEASYDDFVSLAVESQVKLPIRYYNGAPYWTGFYASRPELKTLHYAATRRLLAAEVFGLLAGGNVASTIASPLLDPLWGLLGHAEYCHWTVLQSGAGDI